MPGRGFVSLSHRPEISCSDSGMTPESHCGWLSGGLWESLPFPPCFLNTLLHMLGSLFMLSPPPEMPFPPPLHSKLLLILKVPAKVHHLYEDSLAPFCSCWSLQSAPTALGLFLVRTTCRSVFCSPSICLSVACLVCSLLEARDCLLHGEED